MNNNYDRDEPISLSEAPRSPCEPYWGKCWAVGSITSLRPVLGDLRGGGCCALIAGLAIPPENLGEISEVYNVGG
jgi:hypothetical protein